jgi:hypothetical protein
MTNTGSKLTPETVDHLLGRRFVLRVDDETRIEFRISSFDENGVACCHVLNAAPARQHVPGAMLTASIYAGVLEEL